MNITYLKYNRKTNSFSTYEGVDTINKVSFRNTIIDRKYLLDKIISKLDQYKSSYKKYTTILEKPFRIYKEHEHQILLSLSDTNKDVDLNLELNSSYKRFKNNKSLILKDITFLKFKDLYEKELYFSIKEIESLELKIKEQYNFKIVEGYFENYKVAEEAGAISSCFYKQNAPIDYFLLNEEEHKIHIKKYHYDPIGHSNIISLKHNANIENQTFNMIVEGYKDNKTSVSKNNVALSKLLKGLSYGFEFETSSGYLPNDKMYPYLGIIPLKDGSISGYEFVTVPLGLKNNKPDTISLSKDIKNLYNNIDLLSTYCKVDNRCSLHIHIGGCRKDKAFMVALYKLAFNIQDELFLTQPIYKMNSIKYLGSAKNYCKKLKNLNFEFNPKIKDKDYFKDSIHLAYNKLFNFLSNGYALSPDYNRTAKVHPKGKKWERTERYNWLNMVNQVFNNEETIEFRLHTASLNKDKIINWMFICSAIIKFVENNVYKILMDQNIDYSLENIIMGYATDFKSKKKINPLGVDIANYLSGYIDSRKRYFANTNKIDELGSIETRDDLINIIPGIYIE
jgi:hypothetical protein